MKKLIAALLVSFSFAAFSQTQTIYLSELKMQDLKLDLAEVEIALSYPGPKLSGMCGVEIRSNYYDMKALHKLIKIEKALGVEPKVKLVHDTTIVIDLVEAADMYMTSFTISTLDGRTLKETFKTLFERDEKIVLVTKTCL